MATRVPRFLYEISKKVIFWSLLPEFFLICSKIGNLDRDEKLEINENLSSKKIHFARTRRFIFYRPRRLTLKIFYCPRRLTCLTPHARTLFPT